MRVAVDVCISICSFCVWLIIRLERSFIGGSQGKGKSGNPLAGEGTLWGNFALHGLQSASDQHKMKYPGVLLLLFLASLYARPQTQNCWPAQSCTRNRGQPFGNQFPFGNNGAQPFGNQFPFGNNGVQPFGNQFPFGNNRAQPFGNQFPFNTIDQGQANQQGVQNCQRGQRCNQNNVGPNFRGQNNGGGNGRSQNGSVGGNTQNCRDSKCNQNNNGRPSTEEETTEVVTSPTVEETTIVATSPSVEETTFADVSTTFAMEETTEQGSGFAIEETTNPESSSTVEEMIDQRQPELRDEVTNNSGINNEEGNRVTTSEGQRTLMCPPGSSISSNCTGTQCVVACGEKFDPPACFPFCS